MQQLIALIKERYHPGQLTFTRVRAAEILQLSGKTQDELDEAWDAIEEELTRQNLFMLPALPDALEDEDVRIFRRDAPLTRVLLEALAPTEKGDALMTQTIAALRHKPHPHGNHPKPQRKQHTSNRPPNRPNSQPSRSDFHSHTPDATRPSNRSHYTRPLE